MICCVLFKKELDMKQNPPFLATFFMNFATGYLHSPPTYHHEICEKTMFCLNETSVNAFSTKGNDYLKCL